MSSWSHGLAAVLYLRVRTAAFEATTLIDISPHPTSIPAGSIWAQSLDVHWKSAPDVRLGPTIISLAFELILRPLLCSIGAVVTATATKKSTFIGGRFLTGQHFVDYTPSICIDSHGL